MTKEKISERLTQLTAEFEQAKKQYEIARANVDAYHGAILDCQFWLAEIDKPASAPMPGETATAAPKD